MALTQILTTDSVSASVVNAKIVGPANTALALTDTNLDNLETEVSSHLADIASQDDGKGADMVGLPDPNNLFNATNVGGAMQELFTNVSDGKDLVGGAITGVDDSVVIPTDPTFGDLASAIGGISTGKKWVSGNANSEMIGSFQRVTVRGLEFKPKIVWAWNTRFPSFTGMINTYNPNLNSQTGWSNGSSLSLSSINYSTNSVLYDDGFGVNLTTDSRVGDCTWIAFE